MVLGLSIGRKKTNKDTGRPTIRPSPSLPELSSGGIPWPENLVDLPAIKAVRAGVEDDPSTPPHHGAAKMSFQSSVTGTPIGFHKPFFRDRKDSRPPSPTKGTIASIYTTRPPSSFSKYQGQFSSPRSRRVPKLAQTFNVIVVGAQGTGKTSLLRLFLDTCEISPNASSEQRASVDRFMSGAGGRTKALRTACVEIAEGRYDRVLLTLIDTPGLDFTSGRELELEKSVSGVVKYLDLQYADTMGEEAKVVRQSKGDQHVHLCIYLIDPESIVTPSTRKAKSLLPHRSISHTTFTYTPEDLSSISDDTTSESSEDEVEAEPRPSEVSALTDVPPTPTTVATNTTKKRQQKTPGKEKERLTMSPSEIRVIQRLSKRVNVLPVIARADNLTDDRLVAVKKAIKRDLNEAGVGFGVFGQQWYDSAPVPLPNGGRRHSEDIERPVSAPAAEEDEDEDEEGGDEERVSRPVIKIRRTNRAAPTARPARSRSRRTVAEEYDPTPVPLTLTELAQLEDLLPFAFISPEPIHTSRASKRSSVLTIPHQNGNGTIEPPQTPRLSSSTTSAPATPASPSQLLDNPPPKDLRGKFVRKYRWGTIDVLDPEHCDFAALRTAVLRTHMKVLKRSTKEVLYEKYRTEKLLARRATRNISTEDRKRLLEDLGI